MISRIFLGHTAHQRHTPARHGFRYRMFWFGIDLDELDHLDRSVRGFGHNRRALVSIHDADYGGPGPGTIRQKLDTRLADDGIDTAFARVALVTIPRVLGYVFNPVSFYLCYDADGLLAAFVAEVRNTFGEMHHYTARAEPLAGDPCRYRFRFSKSFYVSPFLDVDGGYELDLCLADDAFDVSIDLCRGEALVFSATMCGRGRPLTSAALLGTLARLPWFAATIMLRIHRHALSLRVRRGIAARVKPEPTHPHTIPAAKPSPWYTVRDRLLRLASRRVDRDRTRPVHTPETSES